MTDDDIHPDRRRVRVPVGVGDEFGHAQPRVVRERRVPALVQRRAHEVASQLQASDRPAVMLRVIPFTHESYADVMQTILYAHGPVPQLDTVHIDNAAARESYRDSPAELAAYRTHFDLAEQASMEPAESRDLLHQIARELQRQP